MSTRGEAAEKLAADYLARRGLRILDRNFRVRGGELDLVCEDRGTTVFVEVRLRSDTRFGGAGASIDARKQRRIVLAARHWLAGKPERPCRFDALLLDALDASRVEWIRDAFAA
jgi:putative endonuclease